MVLYSLILNHNTLCNTVHSIIILLSYNSPSSACTQGFLLVFLGWWTHGRNFGFPVLRMSWLRYLHVCPKCAQSAPNRLRPQKRLGALWAHFGQTCEEAQPLAPTKAVGRTLGALWADMRGGIQIKDCIAQIAQQRLHSIDCIAQIAQQRLHSKVCIAKIAQQ